MFHIGFFSSWCLLAFLLGSSAAKRDTAGVYGEDAGLHLSQSTFRSEKANSSAVEPHSASQIDVGGHSQATLKKTPDFVVNHLSKCGGTYVKNLLRNVVDTGHLTIRGDARTLFKTELDQDFTVGLIRNPFDYYVSLWSYMSEGQGGLREFLPEKYVELLSEHFDNGRKKHSSSTALLKNGYLLGSTEDDVDRFQRWLGTLSGDDVGLMSFRFYGSYLAGSNSFFEGKDVPSNLSSLMSQQKSFLISVPRDFFEAHSGAEEEIRAAMKRFSNKKVKVACWIRVEDLEKTLTHCLKEYEKLVPGAVDWAEFDLAKDEEKFWTNPTAHVDCDSFYNEEVRKLVTNLDPEIFDFFGYPKNKCGA